MGQVNYNLSFSVSIEKVQWSVATDIPPLIRRSFFSFFFLQVAPSALNEMKSKILIKF